MCELYKVHFSNLAEMNGNVNEEALGQYCVDFLVGVVQAFLAMLSWVWIYTLNFGSQLLTRKPL